MAMRLYIYISIILRQKGVAKGHESSVCFGFSLWQE